jgi:hypothetical protein
MVYHTCSTRPRRLSMHPVAPCYHSLTPAAIPQHVVRPIRVQLLHPVLAAACCELCAHVQTTQRHVCPGLLLRNGLNPPKPRVRRPAGTGERLLWPRCGAPCASAPCAPAPTLASETDEGERLDGGPSTTRARAVGVLTARSRPSSLVPPALVPASVPALVPAPSMPGLGPVVAADAVETPVTAHGEGSVDTERRWTGRTALSHSFRAHQ